MRAFNKREKDILNMLYNISNDKLEFFSYHLQHKYFKDLNDSALFIFPKREEIYLYIPKARFDNIEERKGAMTELMEFITLINFLREERYLQLIPNEDVGKSELHVIRKDFDKIQIEQSSKNIILNKNGDYIDPKQGQYIFNSDSKIIFEGVKLPTLIYKQVIENCMGLLFVSEELKEFIRNKFKSKEDIRYSRNQVATWVGISLALIFGILGIINPFNNKQNYFQNNYPKLNSNIKNSNDIHHDMHNIIKILELKKDSANNNASKNILNNEGL